MSIEITSDRAPCVAVVGPANAGKTTLLHQLDEKLKRHLDSFLVLKGNPDGTGRYLYHAPELRQDPAFKDSVKGKWAEATVENICEWITHGRRNLSLALVDFGGRHDEQTAAGNARMLRECSHYLVVSREGDQTGARLWDDLCQRNGLARVGRMRSLGPDDDDSAPVFIGPAEGIEATFRVEVRPGDPVNDAALEPLIAALLALSRPADRTPYVNLHRLNEWRIGQIADVAEQGAKIVELVSRTGVVVVGGAAPIWAYLAALRCALQTREDARVFFFDPRQPERLVEIRAAAGLTATGRWIFPRDALRVSWREQAGLAILNFEITTADKFLPPSAAQNLAGAPDPLPAPSPDVALYGAGPMWLYGAYARRLMTGGARSLASWDARTKSFIQIWA